MKKHFITGLLILLPLALTIAVVVFIVNFLTQPFIGIVSALVLQYMPLGAQTPFVQSPQVIKTVSEIIILITLVIFTFFLGMLARWFFFKSLISFGDAILHRIPVINKVYKTCQEIIKTLFVTDKDSFKQVVLVPFPNDNSYVLGLISRESPRACKEATQKDLITVLVPTAPNPTTGYLFLYDRHKITPIDMKTEEAIKFIVSCGVVTPEHPEISPE
jgi:uncharacterized membrane protein